MIDGKKLLLGNWLGKMLENGIGDNESDSEGSSETKRVGARDGFKDDQRSKVVGRKLGYEKGTIVGGRGGDNPESSLGQPLGALLG